MDTKTISLPVTVKGETRQVEFFDWTATHKNLLSVNAVGAFQKRSGQKIWAHRLTVWKQPDGSWKVNPTATILNRAGYRLIGWADQLVERNPSRHLSAHEVP